MNSFRLPGKLSFLFGLSSLMLIAGLNNPGNHFGESNNKAYLDWVDATRDIYNASFFLPSAESNLTRGVAIHWTIENDTIFLAVAAPASGWLGFGIAEVGGMEGADIFVYETSKPNQIKDAYVLKERVLLTDDCQNWNFVASHVHQGLLIVEVTRALDTGDGQDRRIIRDNTVSVPAHRVIAAWGESAFVGYHGNSRALGAVRWYEFGRDEYAAFERSMAQATGFIDLRADNHSLAAVQTDYVYFCLSWSEILAQGVPRSRTLSIIGVEPIIDPRGAPFVHHYTVFAGNQAMEGIPCVQLTSLFHVWAPGDLPLAYPVDVGVSLGGDGYKSLSLQIHYNNPQRLTGQVDSSGIRIYYTDVPRPLEMGILHLADSRLSLIGRRVGEGLTKYTFDCPSTCSKSLLSAPVTVFREQMHMHQGGLSMTNELIRDGEVVRTSRIDFWSYQQQGAPPVLQEPYQIFPGDAFRTECSYREDKNTRFGRSTTDEMCIDYITYYPKIANLSDWFCALNVIRTGLNCIASYDRDFLNSEADLEREFGKHTAGSCTSLHAAQARSPCPCRDEHVLCRLLHRCE